MMHYKYIFCILTYRNITDICQCIESIKEKVNGYKIVIVNSYYDDETKDAINRIAEENGCDFINVPNRGYGAGNNAGVCFIQEHYDFDYIIISNPDIVITKFDDLKAADKPVVIAPIIVTSQGKNQNPYWMKKNKISEELIYISMKKGNKLSFLVGVGINKIIRELGLLFFRISRALDKKVYAAHGSFMIVSKCALISLEKLYDENMFLFAEEALLAHMFEKKQIPVFLTKHIRVLHKEDGSMKLAQINEKSVARDSVVYYYEKYVRK